METELLQIQMRVCVSKVIMGNKQNWKKKKKKNKRKCTSKEKPVTRRLLVQIPKPAGALGGEGESHHKSPPSSSPLWTLQQGL